MRFTIRTLLHLVSLGFAGGIALSIVGTVMDGDPAGARQERVRSTFRGLMERGRKALPEIGRWRYVDGHPFWEQFRSANFTGHREQARDGEGPDGDQGKGKVHEVDLGQKITVLCISYGGDYTRTVVRYSDPVEVPEDEQRPDTVPLHHVELGDHLWKPLQDFYLVSVADDARSVFFENRAAKKVDNKYPQVELRKAELEMTTDMKLRTGPKAPSARTIPEPRQPSTRWQDPPRTREVRENEWHVSRKDMGSFHRRGNKFFHEDMSLGDYSSGTGSSRVRGVLVRRLGPAARGLGIQQRDILISLNGIMVKSRAEALTEGRRLWRKGVRRFEAVILRRGQEVTLRHYFPAR